jgi:hypothetical protein
MPVKFFNRLIILSTLFAVPFSGSIFLLLLLIYSEAGCLIKSWCRLWADCAAKVLDMKFGLSIRLNCLPSNLGDFIRIFLSRILFVCSLLNRLLLYFPLFNFCRFYLIAEVAYWFWLLIMISWSLWKACDIGTLRTFPEWALILSNVWYLAAVFLKFVAEGPIPPELSC